MIFPEDKLKIASKMLEAAWDSCPLETEHAGLHWMAVATMLQVVLDYEEEKPVIDYGGGENDADCDEGAG